MKGHRNTRRLLTVSFAAVALVASLGIASASASTTSSKTAKTGDIGTQATVPGIDVSHWQGSINWTSVRNSGVQFAYIKATEGTTYKDPRWGSNFTNSYYAGVIRGSYHFARPGSSSGYTQANFFYNNGGKWSADNRTLPGALDLEAGCHGLSQSAMRSWIYSFYSRYKALSGRDVVIYTTRSWWSSCTGGWTGQASRSPMWVAHWGVSSPSLPSGWSFYTFWQYTNCRSVSGISGCVDGNRFNGDRTRLIYFANH
ncbi:MAG: GH25 family lysozyme [Micromonosporaceae bacterium]